MKNQNFQNNKTILAQTLMKCFILTLTILIVFTPESFAGTGGAEFKTWVETIRKYATGWVAMGILSVALAIGLFKLFQGDPKVFGFSILGGLGIASYDAIVNTMVTALI